MTYLKTKDDLKNEDDLDDKYDLSNFCLMQCQHALAWLSYVPPFIYFLVEEIIASNEH